MLKGFRFGMVLQLAIGPICLLVIKIAVEQGMLAGLLAVLGVVIVDGIYMVISLLSSQAISQKLSHYKRGLAIISGLIIMGFGLLGILSLVSTHTPTHLDIQTETPHNPFVLSLILTASNPLTIVFWMGVFSTEMSKEKASKQMKLTFALGALLSTLFFLSLMVILGKTMAMVLKPMTIQLLNGLISLCLIFIGLRALIKAIGRSTAEK